MRVTDVRATDVRATDVRAAALLARLPSEVTVAAVHRGADTVVGVASAAPVIASGRAAVDCLDALAPGFWVGFCSFELGHALERVIPRAGGVTDVPDLAFVSLDARVVIGPDGSARLEGDGEGRGVLEHALLDARADDTPQPDADADADLVGAGADRDGWGSSLTRVEHAARCEAILGHLAAGDCYQVNLTRRLTAQVALDPVALYGRLATCHPAPYAAMLRTRLHGRALAVVSASPECFLRRRGSQVTTQPIKGTAVDAATLRRSAKDHAENVIVVDLARNDLGRVCEPGSIDVPSLCAVESHPGLHHLVSTVRGRLRPGVGIGGLLAATFPPASITGAPKPRVLQIIEDLEPVRRGVYCGAVGWIDTEHDEADLAVAIRTFTVLGDPGDDDACTQLGVGGGIVADSDPDDEWCETELKAARLLGLADVPALART